MLEEVENWLLGEKDLKLKWIGLGVAAILIAAATYFGIHNTRASDADYYKKMASACTPAADEVCANEAVLRVIDEVQKLQDAVNEKARDDHSNKRSFQSLADELQGANDREAKLIPPNAVSYDFAGRKFKVKPISPVPVAAAPPAPPAR
jgi:hypothetical protein